MLRFIDQIRSGLTSDVFTHAALCAIIDGSADKRYALIKRAIAKGEIICLRKGLYCLSELYRKRPLSTFELAQHIYGPSYISFESALSYHGWIPEAVYTVTSASSGKSKDFSNALGEFSYARIPVDVFLEGVLRRPDGVFIARPLRALLDYVYVSKLNWTGIDPVIGSLRVDRDELDVISKTALKRFRCAYPYTRVRNFIDGLEKDLGL
jgi:predicted transcriptional regulator of viral defense system